MEPRIEKHKSRFRIDKLEERIAPTVHLYLMTHLKNPNPAAAGLDTAEVHSGGVVRWSSPILGVSPPGDDFAADPHAG